MHSTKRICHNSPPKGFHHHQMSERYTQYASNIWVNVTCVLSWFTKSVQFHSSVETKHVKSQHGQMSVQLARRCQQERSAVKALFNSLVVCGVARYHRSICGEWFCGLEALELRQVFIRNDFWTQRPFVVLSVSNLNSNNASLRCPRHREQTPSMRHGHKCTRCEFQLKKTQNKFSNGTAQISTRVLFLQSHGYLFVSSEWLSASSDWPCVWSECASSVWLSASSECASSECLSASSEWLSECVADVWTTYSVVVLTSQMSNQMLNHLSTNCTVVWLCLGIGLTSLWYSEKPTPSKVSWPLTK